MLPFQRTFISSYPKATQDTHRPITHATSDLDNWLNLKLVLYLEVLANQKNNATLDPNRL